MKRQARYERVTTPSKQPRSTLGQPGVPRGAGRGRAIRPRPGCQTLQTRPVLAVARRGSEFSLGGSGLADYLAVI